MTVLMLACIVILLIVINSVSNDTSLKENFAEIVIPKEGDLFKWGETVRVVVDGNNIVDCECSNSINSNILTDTEAPFTFEQSFTGFRGVTIEVAVVFKDGERRILNVGIDLTPGD